MAPWRISMNRAARLVRSAETEAALISVFVGTLVLWAQWRYGFNWGDEGWLWYISQRTALAQVPIRDVFSYDPGRYYWSAAVFKILGKDGFFEQLVANYLFGVLGLAITYVAMARIGVSRGWRTTVLILLGIVLGFPRHKIFEQALSLLAAAGIAFILSGPERPKRWFTYGAATGLAAFIGRNSGLYFAIAAILAFILLKLRSRAPHPKLALGPFVAGIVIGYLPIFFMMVRFRGFASAFFESVLLTPKWSWRLPVPFPWHSHAGGLHGLDALQRISVSWLCLAVPITYALILWAYSRRESSGALTLASGASLAGIPYLHHAFYHADFFHIAQGVVPFVVAVGALSYDLWMQGKRRWSTMCCSGLVLLVLGCWLPMEPLVQHLRMKANAPQTLAQVNIDGRYFEVSAQQARVMRTVEAAFRSCGAIDGSFLEAPFYPGLYAFLRTRAPTWDIYYLWPRSDAVQDREIEVLIQNRTSLVLVNKEASFDGKDWLKIGRTNPRLMQYISTEYVRTDTNLPQGFELYALPRSCAQSVLSTM
jgi:hypothetical protein